MIFLAALPLPHVRIATRRRYTWRGLPVRQAAEQFSGAGWQSSCFQTGGGILAGSSVSLRPSARSCRSLPFLRPRFAFPPRALLFLSPPLLRLATSRLSSADTSRNRLLVGNSWVRGEPRDVHVALGTDGRFHGGREIEEDSA